MLSAYNKNHGQHKAISHSQDHYSNIKPFNDSLYKAEQAFATREFDLSHKLSRQIH